MSEKDLDAAALEVYLRFNDDMEKDYCFQITTSTTFKNLFKVFETLPISLRPNVFYNQRPVGFVVSTAPGYLTEDGALLFSYETNQKKYQKRVGLDEKIAKHCWPGQLIMPDWEFNSFDYYSFLTFLMVWLYTDLPDFISPTPGICLTNQMSSIVAFFASRFGYEAIAETVLNDVRDPVNVGAQCVFFFFHLIKVLALYFAVWSGMVNPTKVFRNPFAPGPKQITKEELIELGWTGSKRANPDEYKEFYRNYKIKEHGGMVPAHQAGLFTKLKNLGVFLGDGEGFNTPVDASNKLSDISEDKFVLSYGLFVKLGEYFESYIKDKLVEEVNGAIKEFRRYGLLHCGEEVQEMVEKRKTKGDLKLE